MNLGHLLPALAVISGGIDEGQSSPNNGAGIAGFVLLFAWIAVFVVQVLRRRRRAAMSLDDATDNPTQPSENEDDPTPADGA